jgi:hypothetical protein
MRLPLPATRARGLAFLLLACLSLAAGPASALSLDDLDCTVGSCQSFSTGGLTYDNFNVVISGDLNPSLLAYSVTVLGNGFRLSGPIAASAGQFGDIVLTYDVTSDTPGMGIPGAALSFVAAAAGGPGTFASVTDDFFTAGPGPIGSLFVFRLAVGPSVLSDSTVFGDPAPEKLHVIKDITVIGIEGSTAIEYIDQTHPIPAPAASGLLSLGLLGLWRFGRRRDAPGRA